MRSVATSASASVPLSGEAAPLPADPFLNVVATPSMKATRKYFFAVIGLMLVQIGMGAITAHYAVEGESFFGIPLAQVLPPCRVLIY